MRLGVIQDELDRRADALKAQEEEKRASRTASGNPAEAVRGRSASGFCAGQHRGVHGCCGGRKE